MHANDRPAFDVMLAELFGALDKPLTDAKREGFWKSLEKMSLVDFGRARDMLLRDLADVTPGMWKQFTAGDIWAAKKALRAKAPVFQHEKANPAEDALWDGWALAGNRYLLALVMRLPKLGKLPPVGPGGCNRPSQALVDFTWRMTDAKNHWVRDMRDLDSGEGVPGKIQVEVWNDLLSFTGGCQAK